MSTSATSPALTQTPTKSQRVLSCALCQQRKVKCDRKFPCANCIRSGAECVPTSAPRPRRRRFPERELLERIRLYEKLLHKNNIAFEPLHGRASTSTTPTEHVSPVDDDEDVESLDDAHHEIPREELPVDPKAPNLWHVISERILPGDSNGKNIGIDVGPMRNEDVRDAVIKHAWDVMFQSESNDHLLFGSAKANVHLAALHPDQVGIFGLWQVYLEKINPLLKVTHTPTLQARIIEAVRDVTSISPSLEALLFGIYCVSILSLTDEKCHASFGSSKKDLLARYRFACRQALLRCKIWQFGDRDSLTALYLYIVSIRPDTDPRSLSSTLAVAIRIAQRMGIHEESAYTKYTALEAEMCRRLWWALAILDNRVCEMFDYKATTLAPIWSCKTPINVDDSEIRAEVKTPPVTHEKPTEALFAVVRSELADFVRHSSHHLTHTQPFFYNTTAAKDKLQGAPREDSRLPALEETITNKYLRFCDPESPLHFMTIWTTRAYLARHRLLEHYSRNSASSAQQNDAQRKAAVSYALSMLECDTKLMSSPLTKGYLWLIHFEFPFPAYVHIFQDLRKRPTEDYAKRAWDVMSDNYKARAMDPKNGEPMFIVFGQGVLYAWEACEAALGPNDTPPKPPPIVSDVRDKLAQIRSNFPQADNIERSVGPAAVNMAEMGFSNYSAGDQCFTRSGLGSYPDNPGQAIMDFDTLNQFWTTMDWNWMHT